MIAADTNLLVRHLTHDEPGQVKAVNRLFDQAEGGHEAVLLSHIVLCEVAWVLGDCYDAGKARIAAVIEGLLSSRQLVVEETEIVWNALRALDKSSADFSDALIGQVLRARGCEKIVTFDKAAARLPDFELLG